jgi:hypothetical protein
MLLVTLASCADVELATGESEIVGGEIDVPTSPATDASVCVWHGGGCCSGSLVAPDLVLTAAHCIDRVPDLHKCDEDDDPLAWVPLDAGPYPNGLEVSFGFDQAGLWASAASSSSAYTKFAIGNAGGGPIVTGADISLRSESGHYMSADGGGDRFVGVNRTWWLGAEKLVLERIAGPGPVMSGDRVAIRVWNGKYMVAQNTAAGRVVNATSSAIQGDETFTIRKKFGGAIVSGDKVTLQANSGHYLFAAQGGGGWTHHARARSYAIPQKSDMALLRLEAPVPPAIATPIPVQTRPPTAAAAADPFAYWATQTIRWSGWGTTLIPDMTINRRYRRTFSGNLDGACADLTGGWCRTSAITTGKGDSGGPLYWTRPDGIVRQVAITVGSLNGASISNPTLNVGGMPICEGAHVVPNLAVWLETMLGMTPECTPIDPFAAAVEPDGATWRIRSGSSILENGFATAALAQRAIDIMRHHGMDRKCFVGGALEYNLADGTAPSGLARADEVCTPFVPSQLSIFASNGTYMLHANGGPSLLSLGTSLELARIALGTIQRFDFRTLCRVATAWSYFRR